MRCKVPKRFKSILGRHSDCTRSTLDKASTLTSREVEFSTDPEIIRIRRMVSAVLGEAHMMKSFVRLKPKGEKVLFGYMKPEHDVWYPVGRFFARRFPGVLIVLGNASHSRVFLYSEGTLNQASGESLEGTLAVLERALGGVEDGGPANLWETYYWSQYRREAKNTRYFKQNMREKHLKAAGIAVQTDSGGTRLEDFG